jgi:SSS family solute:Na+ symporter
MTALYVATAVWGLLGTGIALLLINIQSALDTYWLLSGIFGGGMLGLFLLGLISRRAGSPVAATSVLVGILVICWMTLSPKLTDLPAWLRSSLHGFLIPAIGTLTILLVGLALGWCRRRRTGA